MPTKFKFDYGITLDAFQGWIYKQFGDVTIDDREIKKYDAKPFRVVDYYKDGEHIATWSRDRGQVFNDC